MVVEVALADSSLFDYVVDTGGLISFAVKLFQGYMDDFVFAAHVLPSTTSL